MIIEPADIVIFQAGGDGDLTVTMPPSPARPFGRFVIAFARMHFVDQTNGSLAAGVSAGLKVYVDSQPEQDTDGPFDTLLYDFGDVGYGFDFRMAVVPDEVARFTIRDGFGVRWDWTNPQNGDIGWGFETGLIPVSTPTGSL